MRYKDELRIAGVTALFCCAMLMITAVVPKDTTVAKARKTFKEAPETAADAEAQAQYIAGMGFSNVGLGIVHSMVHPLGAHYDTPHGVANALLLPYVMEYNAESPAAPKYIHIAKAMGVDTVGMTEAEGVRAAVDAVRKLSLSIGIPQKLHEINVKEEDLHQLAVDAFNDVCTGGNPRPTSVEDIETLYRKAF